ncbi:MAG: ribbon-helix-helix protein, CopG family [Gemmatimonadetes bacterium]|nr:ribbon-helix-helix protein, CopG family [Gemmatimonadota bacterium]MBI2536265.1 ribbon-helix-helix protein, CopG family [Gemmatimonadota bacterium]
MKDYLTLRLPTELARALTRWARTRRVPKSAIVREAVARYLAPPAPEGPSRRVTGRELAARWATMPHLTPQEAEDFATDLASSREELPPLRPAWD